MARGRVLWLSVLFLGTAVAQPLPTPDPQYSPCACEVPIPYPYPVPSPCACAAPSPAGTIDIGPCNPCEQPVNFVYGQAPAGSVIVRPGQVRFPTPPPIIVQPGQIRLPKPPLIWVKPNAVQPPTPAPITVNPPCVQPPTPKPFYVRVPSVQPPTPEPIVVRPDPVPVPNPPPMRIQPQPVPVPPPSPIIVSPPRILVPSPPTIAFRPNPPSSFRTLGCASVYVAGLSPDGSGRLVPLSQLSGPGSSGSPSDSTNSPWGSGSDNSQSSSACYQPAVPQSLCVPEYAYPVPPCPCSGNYVPEVVLEPVPVPVLVPEPCLACQPAEPVPTCCCQP